VTLVLLVVLACSIIVLASRLKNEETLRKRENEIRDVMVREMNHRLRNLVTTIQSLAFQSQMMLQQRRDVSEESKALVSETYTNFEQKLVALGHSMAIVFRADDRADLEEILRTTLSGFVPTSRFQLLGPALQLKSNCLMGLNLVIHELATNASKYGAWSNATGRVVLSWEIAGTSELVMDWVEEGGPPVVQPSRRGFGTSLIGGLALGRLHGSTNVEFRPEGVTCEIKLPLT
jgi:two-component system CheB/CheR fusion protein